MKRYRLLAVSAFMVLAIPAAYAAQNAMPEQMQERFQQMGTAVARSSLPSSVMTDPLSFAEKPEPLSLASGQALLNATNVSAGHHRRLTTFHAPTYQAAGRANAAPPTCR